MNTAEDQRFQEVSSGIQEVALVQGHTPRLTGKYAGDKIGKEQRGNKA